MGASLMEIQRRIDSTKKTSQITSAMQMVSGSKLNRSEELARNFQIYANKVRQVTTSVVASQLSGSEEHAGGELDFHCMLSQREVKKTGYLVITTDKGLAGGYNSSVIRQTLEMIERDHETKEEIVMMMIGGNGADFFRGRHYNVAYELRGVSDQPSFDEVRQIVRSAVQMYQNEVFDELYVCYNHHVNSLTSQYRVERMLPISDLDQTEATDFDVDYLFEPSEEAILDKLLPQYAESMIYGAILDAKTAEHAARMTAMKSATDNATNIINDLSVSYNRARQATITQEITEIVGGAAALE